MLNGAEQLDWERIAPQSWEGHTQFLRGIDVKEPSKFMDYLNDFFRQVDDTHWIAEEANDGFHVMVQQGPFDPTGRGGAQWYVYKTTKPQDYVPGAAALTERNADLFVREAGLELADDSVIKNNQAPFLKSALGIVKLLDPAMQTLKFGENPAAVFHFLKKVLPDEGVDETRRILKEFGLSMKGPFAVKMAEFARNPRAVAISTITDAIFDLSERRFIEQAFGKQIASAASETPFHFVAAGTSRRNLGLVTDLQSVGNSVGEEGQRQMWQIWLRNISPDAAEAEGMMKPVVDWARRLNRHDMREMREMDALFRGLGLEPKIKGLPFHYGMTRSWFGSYRMPIYDDSGRIVVGWGSGRNSDEAVKQANSIIEEVNRTAAPEARLKVYDDAFPATDHIERVSTIRDRRSQGKEALDEITDHEVDLQNYVKLMQTDDPRVTAVLNARAKIFEGAPLRARKRANFLGFKGDPGLEQPTLKDMEDMLVGNLRETNRLMARESSHNLLKPHLSKLNQEDPQLARWMGQRLNAHAGIQGHVNRAIEAAIDSKLAPVFGDRVASRAIKKINAANYWLTLGALDIGFPLVNALTPIQTVMPEIALALGKTPPAHLAKYMSGGFVPVDGGKGIRQASFFEPFKLMKVATQKMFRPDKKLMTQLRRAADEGDIAPRVVEEFVGEDSRLIRRMLTTGTLTSPGENAFSNFLNIINTPVAMSEEFSRTFSWIVGRTIAKDIWGLTDEGAFQYAKQFTRRTNYGYSSPYRARITTGAVGTGWGLFKNWSFHYIANLANYTGQAAQGNWWPLAYSMLGSGVVGGAIGIPGYGIANKLAEMATDKEISEHLYEMSDIGGEAGILASDLAMYGLPSLIGISLQSRAAAPGSQLFRDVQMMGASITAERGMALADALGTGATSISHGDNPFKSDAFNRKMVRALAPRTAIRAMQAWTSPNGMRSSRTGNVVVADPGTLGKIAFTFGITPLEVEKAFDATSILYEDRIARREAVQYFGRKAAEAMDDPRALQRVAWQALATGADPSSVLRSAQSLLQKQLGPIYDREFTHARDLALLRSRDLR